MFVWLKIGIQINTLKVASYSVQGLYIKLDKKLNLKVNKLTVPLRKSNPSLNRIDETFSNIKYVLTFFDEIKVKEIHFENNILSILFKDEKLKLGSKDYEISGDVHREGKMLLGSVSKLELKKYAVTLQGTFTYDLKEDILLTNGVYNMESVSGNFNASKREDKIAFALNSTSFSNLESVVTHFNLSDTLKSWIVDKVAAKKYALHFFKGKGKIENKTFTLDTDSLKAEVTLSDVNVYFKEDVAPVKAPSVLLNYDKTGLFFDLEKPRYLGKNLTGSKVSIVNLKDENTTLHVNLKLHDSIDTKVQKLLYAYGVPLPVLQKEAKVKGSIDIILGLKNGSKKFVTDLDFLKGDVWVNEMTLPVISGHLHHEDNLIVLEKLRLKNDSYAGILNATVDLKKFRLKGVFAAEYVNLLVKSKSFVSLKNEKLPFELFYKKGVKLNVPKLALRYVHEDKDTTLILSDLDKIKKYIVNELPIEEGGKLEIHTKDFDTYTYKGLLNFSSCFLYESNDVCQVKVDFEGKATKGNIDLHAFNKHLYYNQKKSEIKLSKLHFDLKKFFEYREKKEEKQRKEEKSKKDEKSKKKSFETFHVLGKQSHLRYGDHTLLTDSYDVKIDSNGDIQAIGNADGDIIQFSKVKEIISLEALRIKDKVLHPLINFNGLQQGRYTMSMKGHPGVAMKGHIVVEGGVMHDFKAYNNTLAFINTLPALATLHKPGYSNKGFLIHSGTIDYRIIKKEKIIFDKIYIEGESSNIWGSGEVNLKKKTIDIELRIQLAQSLGTVVGNIPVLGYILVGEDKSVTIGLNITGSLDNPKVSVSTVKDVLSYPIDVIKRTLETPKRIFQPVKKKKEELKMKEEILKDF